MAPAPVCPRPEDRYLRWIGSLQLAKGMLLMALAVRLLAFLHKDVDAIVGNWISELGVSLENPHIVSLLAKLDSVTDRQLGQWSIVTFCLSGMFLTEGTGLLLRRQWGKYVTIVATAAFIPLEAYKTIEHFGIARLILLIVNLLLVWFLVALLRREKRREETQQMRAETLTARESAA
jgi:uncharacterized membrane protein (DUF2068 family)